MSDRQLPRPVGIVDAYLAAIHDRLGELLDRLPPAPQERPDSTVELTEPKRPTPVEKTAGVGEKRAPAGGRGSSRSGQRRTPTSD